MTPLLSLFPLLFFLLTLQGATGMIQSTCKKISENTSNVKYDFCMTSLEAAWDKDYNPTVATIGSVALGLVKKNLTKTKSYIKDLIKDDAYGPDSEPYLNATLSDCLKLYSDTISELEEVVDNYKSQKYKKATKGTNAVLTSLTTCKDGFKKRGLDYPLLKRTDDAIQLSTIVVKIVGMLT